MQFNEFAKSSARPNQGQKPRSSDKDAFATLNPFASLSAPPQTSQNAQQPMLQPTMAAMQSLRDMAIQRQQAGPQATQAINDAFDPFSTKASESTPSATTSFDAFGMGAGGNPFETNGSSMLKKSPINTVTKSVPPGQTVDDPFDMFGGNSGNSASKQKPSPVTLPNADDFFGQPKTSPINLGGTSFEDDLFGGSSNAPVRVASSDSISSDKGLRKPRQGSTRRRSSSGLTRESSISVEFFEPVKPKQPAPNDADSPFDWSQATPKDANSPADWAQPEDTAAADDDKGKEVEDNTKSKGSRLQCPNCSTSLVPPKDSDMFKCTCGQVMVVPGSAMALKIQKQGTIKGNLCFVQDKSVCYGEIMLRVTSKKVFTKWSPRFFSMQDGFILIFRTKLSAAQGVTAEVTYPLRRLQHITSIEVSSDKSCNMLYAFSIIENYATKPEHEMAISKMKAFNQSVPSKVMVRLAFLAEARAHECHQILGAEIEKLVSKG
mgnify:CR=1 FL=1|jgi:hypothetical protein